MIFLVCGSLACTYLLLSAPETLVAVDGAIPWRQESPLRAVVQLLCLNYQFGTRNAGDVKLLGMGLACGAALLAGAVSLMLSPRGAVESGNLIAGSTPTRTAIDAAMVLSVAYVLWSFVSARWSSAPMLAVGGSVLLAMGFVWAIMLGSALNRSAVELILRLWVGVTLLCAIVAIWYYYGRNPNLRAKFPFGNPNFLGAAMLPGVLTAAVLGVETAIRSRGYVSARVLGWVALSAAAIVSGLWVIWLTDSRAAWLGLGVGIVGLGFGFAGARLRVVLGVLSVAGLTAVLLYFLKAATSVDALRSETLRFRLYAWRYALRMFLERPVAGFGQGGFALHGDSYAAADVLGDPQVFETRIEHAHSEWLEVLADLGIVGLALLGGIVVATLLGASLSRRRSSGWVVVALASSLLGMLAVESVGVGLRVPDVMPIFFTVLGLTWAASNDGELLLDRLRAASSSARIGATSVLAVLGILALVLSQQDFRAARSALQTERALEIGDVAAAINHAQSATQRLNPQRAITSTLRLGEVLVMAAERRAASGMNRLERARQAELPPASLIEAAQTDLQAAESHAQEASEVLQSLISSARGFLDSGRLEFSINMLMARLADLRQDSRRANAYFKAAVMALERELKRQPFDPWTAVTFFQSTPESYDKGVLLEILARPLRYHRMNELYAECLRNLANDPARLDSYAGFFEQARQQVASWDWERTPGTFALEKVRIAAALAFLRGEYPQAIADLSDVCRRYEPLPGVRLAYAACHAELADALFYDDPLSPQTALGKAKAALELCPPNFPGRQLSDLIQSRMVHYHLAAGQEAEAMQLLRQHAPPTMSDASLRSELGSRYRRMAESHLPRMMQGSYRDPEELKARMREWSVRALELSPADPQNYLLAAQLAWLDRKTGEVATLLGKALDHGLPPERALHILEHLDPSGVETAFSDLRRALSLQEESPSDPAAPGSR